MKTRFLSNISNVYRHFQTPIEYSQWELVQLFTFSINLLNDGTGQEPVRISNISGLTPILKTSYQKQLGESRKQLNLMSLFYFFRKCARQDAE
jgi:hypothetical protein